MQTPSRSSYDVVIVGGAIYGSSVAWWLTQMAGFDGTVLVIERDPTYQFASTSHTNSCIRQQFSNAANIQVSQFGAQFIHNFREFMGGNPEVPHLTLQSFGYMYLADTPEFAATLKEAQAVQQSLGAATKHMSRDEIAADYPFYQLDDIIGGNHNLVDEGYFDGGTMFDWFKRSAKANGVEYVTACVTAMTRAADTVQSVTLADGTVIGCGTVVNASGPRAAATAAMAGLSIPVVPRKRYTFVFNAAQPLDRDLPLTIDPSGVHMRSEGKYYLAGCPPDVDSDVAYDDFAFDHSLWESKVWPAIATRIPQFEAIKVINEWVGHYAYNTLDQNALLGRARDCPNFIFVNGFSGHGLQQSPAIGRGIAELIAYGEYRSLDLDAFDVNRAAQGQRFLEKAVI
ncbi:NAD(P)/FAD-dependent oxidoreductase [Sulfitobacter guttiformis]|uniref:Glycine/D-amino acid oxidase-like deaminating enzyme n=1 Tax=Sulfitobacter guttiformis TaxID=74349 RepID=A0A420DPB1_9RHOB|nr:FAD-binding oxidoreductase [Sulfitobacter guttiformis]RKE96111.1 glycine/D-amino acid oxidase-like deaminating enzyme [Sulfitobacter guttiformis]